jgi:CheY-like chemotaxis protein
MEVPTKPAPPLVLVVEDDDDQRLWMQKILEDEGYRVEQASNGKLALDRLLALDQLLPTAMLLALAMPVMTGPELLSIVGPYLHLARVPVILLEEGDGWASGHPRAAVAAVLQKPAPREVLLETLKKAIGNRLKRV